MGDVSPIERYAVRSHTTSTITRSVCTRVCARARACGKNNIKEGGPHGSRAPSGCLRRQHKKTGHAVLAACGSVSGACLGRGRGPRLSQNLWGFGVKSPLSLLYHAVRRSATDSASSWQGGGGASTLPRLWGRTRSGPGASARRRLRRFADGVPRGYAPPPAVPPSAGPAGPPVAVDAWHVLWHSSAAPPYPPPHKTRIVFVGVPHTPRGGVVVAAA